MLHGLYLVIERLLQRFAGDAKWTQSFFVQVILGLATYGTVCLAWVFFRATDFTIAMRLRQGMFGTWEPLLKSTNAPGIHFEDVPELSGFNCPE